MQAHDSQSAVAPVSDRAIHQDPVGKRTLTEQLPAVPAGSGSGLPGGIRSSLEKSTGADLSGVRVHSDGQSASAAQAMGAEAYAIGNNIHFASGKYDPGSPDGRHLIAHEVAHTVQQGAGAAGVQARRQDAAVSEPSDPHEVEAEQFADDFADDADGDGGDDATEAEDSRPARLTAAIPGGTVSRKAAAEGKRKDKGEKLDELRSEVRDLYLDVRDQQAIAIRGMKDRFSSGDSVRGSIIASIAKAGIKVVGQVLTRSHPAAGLVIEIGGELLAETLPLLLRRSPSMNPDKFCEDYETELTARGSRTTIREKLERIDSAKRLAKTKRSLRAMHDNRGAVQAAQRNQLLDDWTNALRIQMMEDPHGKGGVGGQDYDDSTAGRIHLDGMFLEPTRSGFQLQVDANARMASVPGQDARNVNVDRRLEDIRVARTFDVGFRDEVGTSLQFAGAVSPAGALRHNDIQTKDQSDARWALASYYLGERLRPPPESNSRNPDAPWDRQKIHDNWDKGLTKVWNQIRGKTLRQLGVGSVGT